MAIEFDRRIGAFQSLRDRMIEIDEDRKQHLFRSAEIQNPWFTTYNTQLAWKGIISMLDPADLRSWVDNYPLRPSNSATVGIVMAGNLPLVGFHDLLCVLLSGHRAAVKMSSQDGILMGQMVQWLCELEPQLTSFVEQRELLKDIDAVIATGSDNSARYFNYYFGKIPHIIRKNRTSVAVIDGDESPEEIRALGHDIYSYFGLGCRNVSKVYVPQDFEITSIFPNLESYQKVIDHHKYRNNYDYNKSIYLVNKDPHLDTGFGLWVDSDELVSPISVTYWQRYAEQNELWEHLRKQEEKIQCIVGRNPKAILFGSAQSPKVWDYADNVDTMAFLSGL
ncbi:MAG: acyl-CoA reductase [Bacteroidota bacterium]